MRRRIVDQVAHEKDQASEPEMIYFTERREGCFDFPDFRMVCFQEKINPEINRLVYEKKAEFVSIFSTGSFERKIRLMHFESCRFHQFTDGLMYIALYLRHPKLDPG